MRNLVSVYLVKIDIVVEWYKISQPGRPYPSDGISTYGQQNDSHVELQGLSRTLSRKETVAHDIVGLLMLVLEELPREKPNQYHGP